MAKKTRQQRIAIAKRLLAEALAALEDLAKEEVEDRPPYRDEWYDPDTFMQRRARGPVKPEKK